MGSGSWESSAARSRFQAAWFGVLLRHSVNVLCGVVYLSFPPRTGVGVAVAVVLIGWGSFRLLTRSMTSSTVVWADYVLVVVVAVTILSTTEGIDVVSSNSLPLAVSGSAVLSFAFSQRHWQAVLAAVGIAVAFAVGFVGRGGCGVAVDGVLAVLLPRSVWDRDFPAAVGRTRRTSSGCGGVSSSRRPNEMSRSRRRGASISVNIGRRCTIRPRRRC